MFRRFINWMTRVMWGRYGNDPFNRCLVWVYLLFWLCAILFRGWTGFVFSHLTTATLAYTLFRMFSRNIPARQAENRWYLLQVTRLKDVGRYRYRRCPHCGSMLRLPIKRGRRTVTCHRCRTQFKAFFL